MSEQLENLQTQLGEIMVEAVRYGGEPLMEKVDKALGVAWRHNDRIVKGQLQESDGILDEMKESIERARAILDAVKAEKPDEADVDLQATDAMISAALPLIDTLFNGAAHGKDRKIGYVLLTFPMNRPDLPLNEGKCNFGSNGANREDLAKMFRFMLKEWEKAGKIEPQPEEG